MFQSIKKPTHRNTNQKIGADLLRRILAGKLLHIVIVPANGYQYTKFQLSTSISY